MNEIAHFVEVTPRRNSSNDTRSRLILAASKLSQEVGYDALSLQDLADELGIRKASIFHYFASKDDLACAVIHTERKSFQSWAQSIDDLSPEDRMTRYFQYIRTTITSGKIGAESSFAASWPLLSEKIKLELRELHRSYVQFFEQLIRDGVALGIFQIQGNALDIARSIPEMIEGAILVGRASASPVPIQRMERVIGRLLNHVEVSHQ